MTTLVKYPRTPHLPESPGATSDDKYISKQGLAHLEACELVVTEKMDGGNFTMYRGAKHARSLSSGVQAWDSAAAAEWARVQYLIPEGWRVCGESMYARRSVAYDSLPGYFLIFSVWDEHNTCLSWDETEAWAEELGLPLVPVLGKGMNLGEARKVWSTVKDAESSEGFVVRNADAFAYSEFSMNMAKYVRANHVQTSADWRHRTDYEANTLA